MRSCQASRRSFDELDAATPSAYVSDSTADKLSLRSKLSGASTAGRKRVCADEHFPANGCYMGTFAPQHFTA